MWHAGTSLPDCSYPSWYSHCGRNWPFPQLLGWKWPVIVIVHVAYSHFIGQWVHQQVNTYVAHNVARYHIVTETFPNRLFQAIPCLGIRLGAIIWSIFMLQLVQLSLALHLKQDSLYKDMICLSTTWYQFGIVQRRQIEITNSTFEDNLGSALGVNNSRLTLNGYNSFLHNCRQCFSARSCSCQGGGI